MKFFLKKFTLCAFAAIALTSFYAFQQYQKAKTAAEVFNNMVRLILYTDGWKESKITEWPDTTLVTLKINGTDTIMTGPQAVCDRNPGGIYLNLANAIDEYDEYKGYTPAYKTSYKQLFGKDLLGTPLVLKEKDYEGKPQYFNQFKGDALLAGFNKLYKKPDYSFEGIAMQHMYDLTLKNYFREVAQTVSDIMKKKPLFLQLAAKYKTEATTKKGFDGSEFGYSASEKLLGDGGGGECFTYTPQLVGTMLRRQVDGSLPTVISCMNKILSDYDPGFKVK